MNFLFEALILGLTLAMMPGPIFVTLLETALSHSRKEGILVGTGIWISDFLVMGLSLFFIDKIADTVNSPEFKVILAIVGGIILIGMGIGSLLKPKSIQLDLETSQEKQIKSNLWIYPTKGFFINTLNPFTFIFWMGVISTYSIGRGYTFNRMVLFLGLILSIIAITDTLKVLLADRVSNLITGTMINKITRISGIGMIIFGIILIIRAFI